ncbi:serine/threonine protein kinase [Aspergillus cavernicola]|uniref:Serine/threonine protein kinase n=1 Tax=Aspergillus cavernicola TaxID=176166 RepID=A0ABR4IBP6_9EURO
MMELEEKLRNLHSLDLDPSRIQIVREITRSNASSIFALDLDGRKYVLKVYHGNGDPRYTEKGRAAISGACERWFVPCFYGDINQVDPAAFQPALQHFAEDKLKPSAILLEYLPNAESLNCVNYSDTLYTQAMEGMKDIHKAGVVHEDVYPKDIVRGKPDRLVWIDFDVATTFADFGPKKLAPL